MATSDREAAVRQRFPLAAKFAVAVVALAALLWAFLQAYEHIGPSLTAAFAARSRELVGPLQERTRALAQSQLASSCQVLVEVIANTTASRTRTLADLPDRVYAADPVALRAAIAAEDARYGERLRGNVAVLAAEMQRRSEAELVREFAATADRQRDLVAATTSELRRLHVLESAGALVLLLFVLTLILHWFVVRPARSLRQATRRIAAGDLETAPRAGGQDELGALAADFGTMVGQLRASRDALTKLNAELESEVARKTEHLTKALADLQRSYRDLARAETMASVGTLAGGVAHEFHNLIGGIRGCASELDRDEQDPARRETLAVILRAADRATSITRQLLRFARPVPDRREPLDVGTVVRDALQLLAPEARRRMVEVEQAIGAELSCVADPDGLHQVFVNLAHNALQAMPHGGSLRVRAHRDGDRIVVAVADTGVGIAADDLPRVFAPFFSRRDAGGDPAQQGTGLGLSVSYGIVTSLGGTIGVTSEPGRGSVFTVTLPASVPPADPTGAVA